MALRKHAYSNILNTRISPRKTESFQIKILIFFIFLLKTWIMGIRYSLNTINIFTSCIDTFKFSLLRTRENTDVSIIDENIYGIHSKRVNILYLYSDPSLQRKPFVPKDVAIKMSLLVKHS